MEHSTIPFFPYSEIFLLRMDYTPIRGERMKPIVMFLLVAGLLLVGTSSAIGEVYVQVTDQTVCPDKYCSINPDASQNGTPTINGGHQGGGGGAPG